MSPCSAGCASTPFVLQTGFNTGAIHGDGDRAAASLMADLLHRPATEFGLYFLLFPMGFFTGNFISTRVGNRISTEAMVLAGSLLTIVSGGGAGPGAVTFGWVIPLAFFLPGTFITMAQGISMPCRARSAPMKEIRALPAPRRGVGVVHAEFLGRHLHAGLRSARRRHAAGR